MCVLVSSVEFYNAFVKSYGLTYSFSFGMNCNLCFVTMWFEQYIHLYLRIINEYIWLLFETLGYL